jgi:hypothetical protein
MSPATQMLLGAIGCAWFGWLLHAVESRRKRIRQRHHRYADGHPAWPGAQILYVAPAMGLVGSFVVLVQALVSLR